MDANERIEQDMLLREKLVEYKQAHGCTWKWIAQECHLGYKTLTNFTSGYRPQITETTRGAIINFLTTH